MSMRQRDNKIRVMVVDDDEQLRMVLIEMLSLDGYHVRACPDAYSALKTLEHEKFDLLLTDLGMPGMSGLELAEIVQTTHPDMPVALITGLRAEVHEDEASKKGVRAILLKPFQRHELTALIRQLVAE
jgi:CheY-like chemotaxis protein